MSSRRFSIGVAFLGISLLTSSAALAGEKTVTLAAPGMYCSAFPITVSKSLEAVPGVAKVVVSLATKTATVSFDDEKTTVAGLITVTTNAGYPSMPKG